MQKNEEKKPTQKSTWDDGLAAATPTRAQFFKSMRTSLFKDKDAYREYHTFMAAFQVDEARDQWIVMNYTSSPESDNNSFVATRPVKELVGFMKAVEYLATFEYNKIGFDQEPLADVEKVYPPQKSPVLDLHYHDVEHFKKVGAIEGLHFDENGDVYRTVKGVIFGNVAFKLSQLNQEVSLRDGTVGKGKAELIEPGLLSEVFFSSASPRTATLDNVIKMGKCLSQMDKFALEMGAFYLTIQKALGMKANFDLVQGLDTDNQAKVVALAAKKSGSDFDDALELLDEASDTLSNVARLGVYTEPFAKTLAECVVYTQMLKASVLLPKLFSGINTVSNNDISFITEIEQAVESAQEAFITLCGDRKSAEQRMDRLKAWIADPEKEKIPSWIPGFLTRYYTTRGNVMEQVNARRANMNDVSLLPADVRPPLQNNQQSPADEAAAAAKKSTAKQTKAKPQV